MDEFFIHRISNKILYSEKGRKSKKYRAFIWVKINGIIVGGIIGINVENNVHFKKKSINAKSFYKKLLRCYFVLIFSIIIFIIGFDYGLFSHLFATQLFIRLMSCQMEMYLLQKTINNIILSLAKEIKIQLILNEEMKFLIKLLIIFAIGFLYKLFLKEKLAYLMDIMASFFTISLK